MPLAYLIPAIGCLIGAVIAVISLFRNGNRLHDSMRPENIPTPEYPDSLL